MAGLLRRSTPSFAAKRGKLYIESAESTIVNPLFLSCVSPDLEVYVLSTEIHHLGTEKCCAP